MSPAIYLALASAPFTSAVLSFIRYRRSRRRGWLIAAGVGMLPVLLCAWLAFKPGRPQLRLVNSGSAPLLVSADGELDQYLLAPTQEVTFRYDTTDKLYVYVATAAGPGHPKTVPLPHGKDKQQFDARASGNPGGDITVEFGP